jgi:hypothetical protein
MDFDHISLWIMEKHLMPLFGEGCAIIRVVNTFAIQKSHESGNVVSSEGYVTPFYWVDHLAILKGNCQVFGRQVHLHLAIGSKLDFSVIPT